MKTTKTTTKKVAKKKIVDVKPKKDWSKFAPISQEEWDKENTGIKVESRSSLGDRQKALGEEVEMSELQYLYKWWFIGSMIVIFLALLAYACMGDQIALNDGFIH